MTLAEELPEKNSDLSGTGTSMTSARVMPYQLKYEV